MGATAKKARSKRRVSAGARVSLADVAAVAGVSIMTVSNVVRGRADLVREETRRHVQAVIDRLNYRPQSFGRALRTAKTSTIGLLIATMDEEFLSSPWTARMVAGLSNFVNSRNYGLLVHRQTPLELEDALLLRLSNTDGLCIMLTGPSSHRHELLARVTRMGHPVIALQEHLDQNDFHDLAVIRQDDYGAGAMIGQHLTEQGAHRLAFIEPAFFFPAMSQRFDGICSRLPRKRNSYLHRVECRSEAVDEIEAAIAGYFERHDRPDAFIAANERVALGTLAALKRRNLYSPDDMLLASFNAFDLWSYAANEVTTIDFPAYDVGARAGQRMIERLETGRFQTNLDVLPANLLVRSTSRRRSTGPNRSKRMSPAVGRIHAQHSSLGSL